jgi:hypothetical protein
MSLDLDELETALADLDLEFPSSHSGQEKLAEP